RRRGKKDQKIKPRRYRRLSHPERAAIAGRHLPRTPHKNTPVDLMAASAVPPLSNSQSDAVWRADRDHFLHPWTHFETFKAEGSLVIAEGRGAYVYDSAGKRYLDGIGGLWCVNIGYGNDEMVQAIADQARRLAFFSAFVDTTNPPAAALAAKLAELAPGD